MKHRWRTWYHCWENRNEIVVPPNQLPEHPSNVFKNPRACSLNHKRKIHLNFHLLHYQIQFPLLMLSSYLLMDILLYSIFPRTWSFMSLLLFSTQLRVLNWFWGRCLLHLEFSHIIYNHLSFPHVGQQPLFNNYFIYVPFSIFY